MAHKPTRSTLSTKVKVTWRDSCSPLAVLPLCPAPGCSQSLAGGVSDASRVRQPAEAPASHLSMPHLLVAHYPAVCPAGQP